MFGKVLLRMGAYHREMMVLYDDSDFDSIEHERQYLEDRLNKLVRERIGEIQIIGNKKHCVMPFGWRKAAKGRTVWRIVEEIINQNLEKYAQEYGFSSVSPAKSEVEVYDFEFCYNNSQSAYVNIKTAVKDARKNKDDISKAVGLINFYYKHNTANLYIATFFRFFTER